MKQTQTELFPREERIKKLKNDIGSKAAMVNASFAKVKAYGEYVVLFSKYQDALSLGSDIATVLANFDTAVTKVDLLLEELKSSGNLTQEIADLRREVATHEEMMEFEKNGGAMAFSISRGALPAGEEDRGDQDPI